MEAQFKPFTYKEKGELKGFDVDLARELAKELNVAGRVPRAQLRPARGELIQGKGDLVISGITMTPERALECAFTEPYFLTRTIALLAKPRADGVRTLADLDDPRAASSSRRAARARTPARQHLPEGDARHVRHARTSARSRWRRDAPTRSSTTSARCARSSASTPRRRACSTSTLSVEPYAIELPPGRPREP